MSEGRSSDWERKLAADVHHRIAPMLRCILSIPTEMQSISENDFECFARTESPRVTTKKVRELDAEHK